MPTDSRIRRASELVLGNSGPEVFGSARAAAILLRYPALDRYHPYHRGEDAEIDETLVALKTAALIWRDTANGTRNAARPEFAPQLKWLSTKQAAEALAMTDRAIRKAAVRTACKRTLSVASTESPENNSFTSKHEREHHEP